MIRCYRVVSVPDRPFSRALFLERLGDAQFLIFHSLSTRESFLIVNGGDAASRVGDIGAAIPGLGFSECTLPEADWRLVRQHFIYRRVDGTDLGLMADVFDSNAGSGFVCVGLEKEGGGAVEMAKEYIEKELGARGFRESTNFMREELGRRLNKTVQKEVLDGSEDAGLLSDILMSVNESLLTNGSAYKAVIFSNGGDRVADYVRSKFVILGERAVRVDAVGGLFERLSRARCLPCGSSFASNLINFYGRGRISYVIPTNRGWRPGGIGLGTFLKDSVHDTGSVVGVDASALNLGFVISGLPGSGKTREAMAVLDQIRREGGKAKMFVIAPSSEWGGFALSHNMHLIRMGDRIPINLFRCPRGADLPQFYQNLAMILAAAASAGPYTNPLEKCLLNAFRKAYSTTGTPDPIAVHSEIEESIVRMHGRRTNVGVKYTKHGENIRSALENLVAILSMPEYSEREGVEMEELADDGVVFDLSGAGVGTMMYFYALLLGQVYAIASTFRPDGDNELRLVLCLEEAQMMFKDPKSAAVEDIKHRIQDFRKKGVGLILLSHNITDIDLGIRRLCQLKMYLKQAPDVAPIAAKDLVFTYADDDAVVSKLKHLDSRVGALSSVEKLGDEKVSSDTVFVRTIDYTDRGGGRNAVEGYVAASGLERSREIECSVVVDLGDAARLERAHLHFRYLGEIVADIPMAERRAEVKLGLLNGRSYRVELVDGKRTCKTAVVRASPDMRIVF